MRYCPIRDIIFLNLNEIGLDYKFISSVGFGYCIDLYQKGINGSQKIPPTNIPPMECTVSKIPPMDYKIPAQYRYGTSNKYIQNKIFWQISRKMFKINKT